MSRGLGRVERKILDWLSNAAIVADRTSNLASHVYGQSPTPAQLVSIRRALRKLVEQGRVRRKEERDFFGSARSLLGDGRATPPRPS